MTKSSTQNNNNVNANVNVNQFVDFFPGFKLQQEQYSKVKTSNGKSWPRAETVLEKQYSRFITEVVNPSNNRFYMPLDENSYPISMSDNGPSCRHVVHTIVRIKTLDGSEKLYSLGELIGYDGASIRRSMGCNKPEVWESVKFGFEKTYNQDTKRFNIYSTGPIGNETKYVLDFNSQNFDQLYAKTWDGKNLYFKPNRRNSNKRVTLIIKEEQSGTAIEIFWQSIERSCELMKTKSFEELFTGSYLPLAVREERARFNAGYMEEQQKTAPTTTSPSDASSSPSSSINNTSAYK